MLRKYFNQKEITSPKTEVEKTKLTEVTYNFYTKGTYIGSRVSRYFPKGGHSVTRTKLNI